MTIIIPELLAEVVAALEPFARAAETFEPDIPNDGSVVDFYLNNAIHVRATYWHFRRAAALLPKLKALQNAPLLDADGYPVDEQAMREIMSNQSEFWRINWRWLAPINQKGGDATDYPNSNKLGTLPNATKPPSASEPAGAQSVIPLPLAHYLAKLIVDEFSAYQRDPQAVGSSLDGLRARIAAALAKVEAETVAGIVAWLQEDIWGKTLQRDPIDGDYKIIIDLTQLRALARAIERGEWKKP